MTLRGRLDALDAQILSTETSLQTAAKSKTLSKIIQKAPNALSAQVKLDGKYDIASLRDAFALEDGKATESYAQEYYKQWVRSIGAEESAKTLEKYYEMKHNRQGEYELLKQYARDVETGWITPLSGFENYKNLHDRIQTEIVGKTVANDIVITGQVPHFMQRVIGTSVDPQKLKENLQIVRRSGVELDDIESAVFFPERIEPILTRESGQRSVKFVGKNCAVTINPDTGKLIQTNPL